MTEPELRKWAKARLRVQWTFEERADSEVTLKASTALDLDDFDFALSDIEAEARVNFPLLTTARYYDVLYRVFTYGVCHKLLTGKMSDEADNVKLGNDDFSKSFTNLKELNRNYETKYYAALEEYNTLTAGMCEVVQRQGLVYSDQGEDETEY